MFQQEYYQQVIPLLQSCLSDVTSARVQARGAAAFITFLECCDDEYIEPYLDPLLQALFERLQRGKRSVQEQAVTALASVAECAARSFGGGEDEEDEKVSIPDFGRYYYFFPTVTVMIDFYIFNFWLF